MVADIFSPSTRLHFTSPSIDHLQSSVFPRNTNNQLSIHFFSSYSVFGAVFLLSHHNKHLIIATQRIHHTLNGKRKACYASLITKIKHFFCSVEQWLCTVDKKKLEFFSENSNGWFPAGNNLWRKTEKIYTSEIPCEEFDYIQYISSQFRKGGDGKMKKRREKNRRKIDGKPKQKRFQIKTLEKQLLVFIVFLPQMLFSFLPNKPSDLPL